MIEHAAGNVKGSANTENRGGCTAIDGPGFISDRLDATPHLTPYNATGMAIQRATDFQASVGLDREKHPRHITSQPGQGNFHDRRLPCPCHGPRSVTCDEDIGPSRDLSEE